MAGRFKYGKRLYYPHMIDVDKAVWNRFVDKFPELFETVDYDFRVGKGSTAPMGFDENMSRMVTMLSQKRIDVIGWVDDQPTIIEVKNRVGLSTLGQVLGYKILFEREFSNFLVPETMVVCARISFDDHIVLKTNNIPVFVV